MVSNRKYSCLYSVRVHDKIVENQGGEVGLASQIPFHLSLERFDGLILRFIEWAFYCLGANSICVFFTRISMTKSKMAAKTSIFCI